MKQHEEVLVQLKAEIEAMEGEEGEVQARLMDLRHELERYSAKMKENQQKIKHFQNEVGEWRGEEKGRGRRKGKGEGEGEGREEGREEGEERVEGSGGGKNGREGCMWRGRVSMFGREGISRYS